MTPKLTMKTIAIALSCVVLTSSMTSCETPEGRAALIGAGAGAVTAAVVSHAVHQRHDHHYAPRRQYYRDTRGRHYYYDHRGRRAYSRHHYR